MSACRQGNAEELKEDRENGAKKVKIFIEKGRRDRRLTADAGVHVR